MVEIKEEEEFTKFIQQNPKLWTDYVLDTIPLGKYLGKKQLVVYEEEYWGQLKEGFIDVYKDEWIDFVTKPVEC